MTSKLFKGLIRRQAGGNNLNPFSKGSMCFDDYSYKYFNDHVLHARLIEHSHEKRDDLESIDEHYIDDDDENSPKHQRNRGKSIDEKHLDDESVLTAE